MRQISVILPSPSIVTFTTFRSTSFLALVLMYKYSCYVYMLFSAVTVLQFLTHGQTLLTLHEHLHVALLLFELFRYMPNGVPITFFFLFSLYCNTVDPCIKQSRR